MDDRDASMAQLSGREALLAALRGLRADIDRAIGQAVEERLVQPGGFGDLSFRDVIALCWPSSSVRTSIVARWYADCRNPVADGVNGQDRRA